MISLFSINFDCVALIIAGMLFDQQQLDFLLCLISDLYM